MKVFKTKAFARFARKAGIADADLGGGVIKQRIARRGGGKSGGFRTVIVFRAGDRAFFIRGFAKNERDTIEDDELALLKKLAAALLTYDMAMLARAVGTGALTEILI